MLSWNRRNPFTTCTKYYYNISNLGEQFFLLVWDVIKTLEHYDIPVVSLTRDGAKPNRAYYKMCQLTYMYQKSNVENGILYKASNPFREGQYFFFFCYAPHLLKTAHNCSATRMLTLEVVRCRYEKLVFYLLQCAKFFETWPQKKVWQSAGNG